MDLARTAPFPLIEIEGSPTERGRAYGRAAGERILRSIEVYRSALANDGLDWEAARVIARRFAPDLDRSHPLLMDELRGIAEGVAVDLADIVAINARTELLYGREGPPRLAEPDGCTGAIALPEATHDGRLLHAQNWDWRDECAETAVVLHIRPDTGPDILTFVEAGLLARCGMNSAGVALTGNFLQCEHDFARAGTPAPFIRRSILMANGLSNAVETVLTSKFSFSANMMISEAWTDAHGLSDGMAVDLEATPVECFWLTPEDGLLVHSNHFLAPTAQAKVHDLGLIDTPDSIYRDVRVRDFLRRRHGRIDRAAMIVAFQDRFGAPRAVCRSPVEGPGGSSSSTVATIVMDASAGRMWVAPRPYGPHEFTEYRLG